MQEIIHKEKNVEPWREIIHTGKEVKAAWKTHSEDCSCNLCMYQEILHDIDGNVQMPKDDTIFTNYV